jgi:vacuolar protein sorting-associated protein IST1
MILIPTELNTLREMLMHKYGREFSLGAIENRNNCVSERVRLVGPDPSCYVTNSNDLMPGKVMKKLVLSTPSPELVDGYLFEIAKGYGVSWNPPASVDKKGESDDEPKEVERDPKVCPIFRRPHPFHVLDLR